MLTSNYDWWVTLKYDWWVSSNYEWWVTLNYDWQSGISVSSFPVVFICIKKANIKTYKAVYHSSGLKIPDYYNQASSVQSTRSYHPLHYSAP